MPETITGNGFLDALLEHAPAAPSQPRRGQNYNYPERLYLLPDGRVEKLQGDPHNRAYYEDKGYHLLSEAPSRAGGKSEVRQYVEDEYPKLLAEQIEKAKIINNIRKTNDRDPTMNLDTDYDGWSLEDLRDEVKNIKEQFGRDIRSGTRGRRQATPPPPPEDKLLSGVETAETMSIEQLEQRRGRPPRPGGAA